jgi:hypothetical protein
VEEKRLVIADVGQAELTSTRTIDRTTHGEVFRYIEEAAWEDQTHVVFIGRVGSSGSSLWRVEVSHGEPEEIGIPGMALGEWLALGPDREWVAVGGAAPDGYDWRLCAYHLRTRKLVPLTSGGPWWPFSITWREVETAR